MADAASLSQRIKAEFDARAQRAKSAEQERARQSQSREARLATFTRVCDDLRAVWGPRLEEFAKQFGDAIKMTPTVQPSLRAAKVAFLSGPANMTLTLSASADPDDDKLVLNYDLLIIPMLFDYQRSARLEIPLSKVDRNAVGKWIDDQLVSCVKAYLSTQDNEHYIKLAMVEDPISGAKFLKEDAAAKFDHNGRLLYFTSEENLEQYKRKHMIEG